MSKSEHFRVVLGDISRSGVYHMPHIDPQPLLEAAEAIGCAIFRIDLGGVRDKGELLAALGKAMEFPDWYGHNLDALADCLNDFAWQPADGYLILLERCDGIHGRAEGDFVATLEVFEQAAAEWREQGIPFWCFVDMQADGINWLPDAD
ncbi:MAG: barstar family protein [Sterolibacteriaceae bacterium MAG5]|nr:barstar family protein [Candidatus Nitricoxidireducens bremensis]